MSARMGPRLPLTAGMGLASMCSIIGIRKLSVLPVPVEAVARMSAPSSAGGIALACTGRRGLKSGRAETALQRAGDLEVVEVDVLQEGEVGRRIDLDLGGVDDGVDGVAELAASYAGGAIVAVDVAWFICSWMFQK